MNYRLKNNLFRKTLGTILPIFLFILAFSPAISLADNQSQTLAISFRTQAASLDQLIEEYSLQETEKLFEVADNSILSQYYSAKIAAAKFNIFLADAKVFSGQVDQPVSANLAPNDPYFTINDNLDSKQWYLPKIGMPKAWEFAQGRSSVTVAIVDTGIHASHVELNDGRVIAGHNTITKKDIVANSDSDDNGHGTAVSGIIGAMTNNNRGVAGINWDVKLMPVKALNADGKGMISAVSSAIVWATDHGADIINLSLGGAGFGADEALNAAVQHAYRENVLVVAAAGNDMAAQGTNLDSSPIYPICADNGENMVLGVAASDVNDRKADFSNFGINCVDITAPGKKILTTAFLPNDPSNNVLIYGSGTSVAAPIVSGVAALLKSNNQRLNNKQIRDLIIGTADNIDALNKDNCLGSSCAGFLGKGRINAAAALSPRPLTNGVLIRKEANGKIYRIESGMKHYVSKFVFEQRGYNSGEVKSEYRNQLEDLPTGDPVPPFDGTLIKSSNDKTVYIISQGLKRPVSAPVFQLRNLSFANVKNLPANDVRVLAPGNWYWPENGTAITVDGSSTVYVMDLDVIRPTSLFVFNQRGLSFAKVAKFNRDDFSHLPKAPDKYWLAPKEGTLVKSPSSPTIYMIQNGKMHAVSAEVFKRLRLSLLNVKTLPQAELDVLAPGDPLF